MTPLGILVASAGNWQGSNILHDPNTGIPEESLSTMVVTPVLEGQFVRVEYTWVYQGVPQQGSIVLRSGGTKEAPSPDGIRAHWTDSWHMSGKVMECQGKLVESREISLSGTWTPPEGPDWGWRIVLGVDGGDSPRELTMRMYLVWPEGDQEALAVETLYKRDEQNG